MLPIHVLSIQFPNMSSILTKDLQLAQYHDSQIKLSENDACFRFPHQSKKIQKGLYFRLMQKMFLHIKKDTMVHFGTTKDHTAPTLILQPPHQIQILGKFSGTISENFVTFGPLERPQIIFWGQTGYPRKIQIILHPLVPMFLFCSNSKYA